jgi:catechol 2,3-dioxygenase-like lactoylglutathione lyase family enzyme
MDGLLHLDCEGDPMPNDVQRTETVRLKGLSHMALGVRDLDRQSDFYVEMGGLRIVDRTSKSHFLRAAGPHHHVLELRNDHRGLHHVAFEVADQDELERAAAILARHGIQVQGPERGAEPGTGRSLRFRDPEGNTIELASEMASR